MRRALLLAALVLVTAVAPPAAAQSFDPDDACRDGDDATVVGVLDGTDRRVTGEEMLYADADLRLVLCSGGSAEQVGSAWNLSSVSGLAVTGVGDQHLDVTVTGEADEVAVDADAIERKASVDALTIRVQRAPVVDSGLGDRAIPFQNGSAAASYAERESAYLDALDGLNATADRLNATADRLAAGDGDPEAATALLDAVEENRSAVSDAGNLSATQGALERDLYRAAWETGERTPLAAVEDLRDRRDASERRVAAALDRYERAMQDRRTDVRNDVLVNAAIGLAPGFLVGAAVAVGFVRRRKQRVSYDRKFTNVEFEASVLAWPALGAVAVLLATAAAVALLVPDLLDVILP